MSYRKMDIWLHKIDYLPRQVKNWGVYHYVFYYVYQVWSKKFDLKSYVTSKFKRISIIINWIILKVSPFQNAFSF